VPIRSAHGFSLYLSEPIAIGHRRTGPTTRPDLALRVPQIAGLEPISCTSSESLGVGREGEPILPNT
jgi:hypothetical protein